MSKKIDLHIILSKYKSKEHFREAYLKQSELIILYTLRKKTYLLVVYKKNLNWKKITYQKTNKYKIFHSSKVS